MLAKRMLEDDEATAEIILKDGVVVNNARFEGVTLRAIGSGQIRVISNSTFNMRPGQGAALRIDTGERPGLIIGG